MSFDLELSGKRALVTGGTKGVGAAVVNVLGAAGVRVVATARAVRHDEDGVYDVAADIMGLIRSRGQVEKQLRHRRGRCRTGIVVS